MATFRACIFAHQKKADGTYNIKLRITHHQKSRWMKTSLYAIQSDLTRSLKIKNEKLARQCRQLEEECIDICNGLGYATEAMSVDDLVERVKDLLSGKDRFRLDFMQYMAACASSMRPGTGSLYITTLNALKRYVRRESLDVGELNATFMKGFVNFIATEPSQRGSNRKSQQGYAAESKGNRALSLYVSRIKTIYNRAKEEFNDEERGIVQIKGNPFRTIKIETPPPTAKRAISTEVIQRMIDLPRFERETVQMARDCFLLSFAVVGMNSADMLACGPAKNREIIYYRKKTASRRADNAEMHVLIEPCIEPLMGCYSDDTGKRLFNFHLRYASSESFNKALNKGLKVVGAALGIEGLTFYAARHSWATIARAPQVKKQSKSGTNGGNLIAGGAGIEKYVVHEALNHVDQAMKVTDIYLVKNWQVIWDANKKVLKLFDWSKLKL